MSLAELHTLCSQLVEVIVQRCSDGHPAPMPYEFALILKKDRDVFNIVYTMLRNKWQSGERTRALRAVLKTFSTNRDFRVMVSVFLHQSVELGEYY